MKIAAITLAGLSLAVAGSAAAQDRASDLDYLKASRCKGLAQALGSETANLDAYLKAAGRGRSAFIAERSEAEVMRAKREARGSQRDKAAAELSGPCGAYSGPKDVAVR